MIKTRGFGLKKGQKAFFALKKGKRGPKKKPKRRANDERMRDGKGGGAAADQSF